MRTTMILDDHLLTEARRLTRITRLTDLVRHGLEKLIESASRERLASLGGTEKHLRPIPRRRS